MAAPRSIEITILGRAYKVACSREEEPALVAAAHYLDDKMREIRDTAKVIGAERIAIMAGLNLAHELLNNGGGGQTEAARARLAQCNAVLDVVLEDQDELF
jgi:cell division protein ZapA